MDFEGILAIKRNETLADIADMYYNRGLTQSEIAKIYDTNRFRIAKLIQEARNEKIVEIHINTDRERNSVLEAELEQTLGLQKAIVVNMINSSYDAGLGTLGKIGARYLNSIIEPDTVIGLCWGKTIHSVISQLQGNSRTGVTAIQLCGRFRPRDPIFSSREMVRMVAMNYNGKAEYVYLPLYLHDSKLVELLKEEPLVRNNFRLGHRMNIIVSGIGSRSSIPFHNSQFEEYLTEKDRICEKTAEGSIYGYVLDENGAVADTDLNQKLVACDLEDIWMTEHRLVIAAGRHKTQVLAKAGRQKLYNELITDSDTAYHLLDAYRKLN